MNEEWRTELPSVGDLFTNSKVCIKYHIVNVNNDEVEAVLLNWGDYPKPQCTVKFTKDSWFKFVGLDTTYPDK